MYIWLHLNIVDSSNKKRKDCSITSDSKYGEDQISSASELDSALFT